MTFNDQLIDIRGIFATVQWILTFVLMGPLSLAGFFYLFFCTKYWFIPLLYLFYFVIDKGDAECGGRQSKTVRNWKIFKWMAEYFPVTLIKTAELDKDKNYLLGYHPHGVLNIGGFLNFAVNATNFDETFPGFKSFLTALNGHFNFPIYRDYILLSGLVSNTKKSVRYLLNGPRRRGSIIVMNMGGAPEALYAHPKTNKTIILKNLFLFKRAIESGTPIIPCFSFGENNCFNQVENTSGSTLRKIQEKMTKIFGFSPPLFYGRGIAPLKRPINTVVGKPIPVTKIENPTEEDLLKLRNEYITALRDLFDQYRPLYANEDDEDIVIL